MASIIVTVGIYLLVSCVAAAVRSGKTATDAQQVRVPQPTAAAEQEKKRAEMRAVWAAKRN